MYKRILISAIAVVCCLATLPCAAQVTIKFKSLKISNVTDNIWEPEKDLFCAFRLPSYDRGDVYLRIEAEIVNEGDTAVLFGAPELTVDDAARFLDTINYEVTCLVSPRVPRVYVRY